MRASGIDRRPKVLSLGNRYDGLQIAVKEDILWPCHAFNVSIPINKEKPLNVFEETVLKLTEVETGDSDIISRLTCLNRELVVFIQNRLKHYELLDDRYELTLKGIELLAQWNESTSQNIEYTVATMFVDLMSGQLIPYITTKSLRSKKIEKLFSIENTERKGEFESFVSFLINPTKEKSRKTARRINPSRDAYWKSTPDISEVISALREFRNRYKRFALLNASPGLYPYDIPANEAITINPTPELVYLHCVAIIQVGNPEILVTDGCGYGFSESFANYLSSQELQWLIDFKSKGLIDRLDATDSKASDPLPLKGYSKYNQVERPLRSARKHLKEVKNMEVLSSSSEDEYNRLVSLSIVELYEAIEWTLRHIVSENPAAQWEQIFTAQSFRENDDILRSFAKKIGFDVPDSLRSLLQVVPGKIKALNRGESEMQPLLAMAIAGAVSDHNHPFHTLATNDAGSLNFIRKLKEDRDPTSHGSSKQVDITIETLEIYHERALKLIRALIPEVGEDPHSDERIQTKDIDQERLKARIELESVLGFVFVHRLSSSLKDELVKMTILTMRSNLRTDQHQRFINIMCSIMQTALFEFVADRRGEVNLNEDYKGAALDKIVRAGFCKTHDAIPKQLSTVNGKRVGQAVQGRSTTLGAQLLGAFIVGEESELVRLQQSDPAFVEFIADLLRLRGHGNRQGTILSKDQMKVLKNTLFQKLKIIRGLS